MYQSFYLFNKIELGYFYSNFLSKLFNLYFLGILSIEKEILEVIEYKNLMNNAKDTNKNKLIFKYMTRPRFKFHDRPSHVLCGHLVVHCDSCEIDGFVFLIR